jgi:hypothetical protein
VISIRIKALKLANRNLLREDEFTELLKNRYNYTKVPSPRDRMIRKKPILITQPKKPATKSISNSENKHNKSKNNTSIINPKAPQLKISHLIKILRGEEESKDSS